MTQKEILKIKKLAKKCLKSVGINIPMVKMDITLSVPSRDGWIIHLVDVRTKEKYCCVYDTLVYKVYVYDTESGKPRFYKEGSIGNGIYSFFTPFRSATLQQRSLKQRVEKPL